MMKAYFAYRDGPVVGPFHTTDKDKVYNEMMDMANSGEAPEGRPGEGDLIGANGEVWEVSDFGYEFVASGPAGRGMIAA